MCLERKSRQTVIQKSNRVIKVYKILKPSYEQYEGAAVAIAPHRNTTYKRGETKITNGFSNIYGIVFSSNAEDKHSSSDIYQGLHAYVKRSTAIKNARMYGNSKIVVECTIPRRTPLVLGKGGEIVTLELRVGKAVYGTKESYSLKDSFNERRF